MNKEGCPNPDCKARLDEVHEAVFEDREGGCRWDIQWLRRNFLTKKAVWGLIIAVGIPAYYTAIDIWASEKSSTKAIAQISEQQKKLDDQGERRETRLTKLEEQFSSLKEIVKEVKDAQKDNTDKILHAIRNHKQ